MNFRSLLVPILFIITTLPALATTQPALPPEHVVDVQSDGLPGICKLEVVRQPDGAIIEMIYISAQGYPNHFPVSKLQKEGQQPLLTLPTFGNVLFIDLEKDFDEYKGGHAIVRFMTNVAFRTKKEFRILVQNGSEVTFRSDPNPEESASDNNPYTGQFNHLFVAKQRAGIKALIPSMQ